MVLVINSQGLQIDDLLWQFTLTSNLWKRSRQRKLRSLWRINNFSTFNASIWMCANRVGVLSRHESITAQNVIVVFYVWTTTVYGWQTVLDSVILSFSLILRSTLHYIAYTHLYFFVLMGSLVFKVSRNVMPKEPSTFT